MPVGYEVTNDQGQRAWWDGKKLTALDDNGFQTTGSNAQPKLTEDQGKVQGYGKIMTRAEQQYLDARRAGYNPGSLRNAAADTVEDFKVPLVGKPFQGLGALIRDDASDQGRAAERAWLDAQLKAMTGAGQSASETVENPRTYFPQFGEGSDTYRNKYDMRQTAYDAIKRRAGPAAGELPKQYPNPANRPAAAPPEAALSALRQNPKLANQFDAKYGKGAAAKMLGGK